MKTYAVHEVATILSVSVESIRRYLKAGKLKGSKIGGQWRIAEQQVKDFFNKNSN